MHLCNVQKWVWGRKPLGKTRLKIISSICDYFACLNISTVLKFVAAFHLSRLNQSFLLGSGGENIPGVTERTTTGFSLPATNPNPSTGSLLISTFRGAGGVIWQLSIRGSSNVADCVMWLWKKIKDGKRKKIIKTWFCDIYLSQAICATIWDEYLKRSH